MPGYDLAPFRIIARIAIRNGYASLWQILLWACVAVTIAVLWKLTGAAPAVLIAAFVFSDGYRAVISGNLAPIAIACIAVAALCASQRRRTLATISMVFAMCEPHIALGGAYRLDYFLFPLHDGSHFFGVTFLGAVTYATTGITMTLEFIQDVLPRQILAEVAFEEQYSLTHLLHLASIPDHIAILLGNLSYAISVLIVGTLTAAKLRARLREEAFLISSFRLRLRLSEAHISIAFQLPAASCPPHSSYMRKFPRYRTILGASDYDIGRSLDHRFQQLSGPATVRCIGDRITCLDVHCRFAHCSSGYMRATHPVTWNPVYGRSF